LAQLAQALLCRNDIRAAESNARIGSVLVRRDGALNG